MEMVIKRVNHVQELSRKQGWKDRKTALREIIYLANLTRPTAEKAYDGDTDLSMDTVEKLAALFNVTKEQVLESKISN